MISSRSLLSYYSPNLFARNAAVLADRVRPALFVGLESHKCGVNVTVLRDPIESPKDRGHGQSAEVGVGQLRPRLSGRVIFKDPQPQYNPRLTGCGSHLIESNQRLL